MKKVDAWMRLFIIVILYVFLFSFYMDTFAAGEQDTVSVSQIHKTEIVNVIKWIESHPALISFVSAIIAAIIGTLISVMIQNRKLKKKLTDEEREKEEILKQKARLEAREMLKTENRKKSLKTEEDRYLDFIITENEKLTFQGFETQVRVPILLWDIYVPLRANMAGTGFREGRGKEIELAERDDLRNIPVQEAVKIAGDKKFDGLVILGDPGAGKTTLLKYFLLCFAKKEAAQRLNLSGEMLPILLHLRSVDMKKTLVKDLCAQFEDHDLNLTEAFFLDRLEKGRAIVLLDGLDEVADENARVDMCHWIHRFRNRFSRCPFIITSRYSGYRGDVKLPGTYLELNMLDFSKLDIQQFLHSWYKAVETSLHEDSNYWRTKASQSAESLFKKLEKNTDYLKFAVNPLMLQLIALVHYDSRTVPDRRVVLYGKCMDMLLQKWDEAKGLKVLLSAEQAREVLQPIALWMHSEEHRRQASKKDILGQIEPLIQQVKPGVDSEKFLNKIRDRSGVFVGYGTETFGFQHHSFQEYLTAEEIRNKGKADILVNHFDESWWREPTLLALGLSNPSIFESFMKQFLVSDRNDSASVDFMLRCVRESIKRSEKPFEEVLFDEGQSWHARYNCLLCLGLIGSDRAKDLVEKVLLDPHPKIKDKARELLVSWGKISKQDIEEKDLTTGLLSRIFNPVEDNAEYILIPGGTYVMGDLKKKVTVKPFYLAKFPVTNGLYRKFVKETGYRNPLYWDDKRFNGDDQPVVGVSWEDANAYCEWLTDKNKDKGHYRLPMEEEWEWAAARGEREYPWGDKEPDHKRANYGQKIAHTTPVGSYPDGATLDGLMDMAGNVWEWTGSYYDKEKNWIVLRGGSWLIDSNLCRCAVRSGRDPYSGYFDVGFRCART